MSLLRETSSFIISFQLKQSIAFNDKIFHILDYTALCVITINVSVISEINMIFALSGGFTYVVVIM